MEKQGSPPVMTARGARIKADFTLLLVTFIWGLAFVVQRYSAPQVGVFLFNGLRFTLGALVLIPVAMVVPPRSVNLSGINRGNIIFVIIAGILLFSGAAFQQAGLMYTTAGNAGFITGLYVIFIPLILAFVLKKWPRRVIWISAGMATVGLYLLSTGSGMRPSIGDWYVLVSALIWSFQIILLGWIVQRMEIIQFAVGQYLVCAVFSIVIGLLIEGKSLNDMNGAWWVILFTGVLSVGIGYTLQAVGQRSAPPADAALILSVEAVFASILGWILLDEFLMSVQILGCGIIFSGMLLSQSHLFLSTDES